jgi:predicted P-loop ATPase
MTETSEQIRESSDEFGKYWEEKHGNGWRKFKREANGIEFRTVGSKTDDYINALRANKTYLRLNDMSDRIEIKNKGPITDVQESVIINRLTDCDMKNEGKMRRAIQEAAHRERYHPVKEYLDGLESDGKDHFAALMNKLEMSSPLAEVFWRKFLIGSIAKAIDAQQNFMLVLVGAQGKGKSRLVNWLCPLENLYNEGPVSPDNKDDLLMLLNTWLWEVAELDSTTRKADRSALKHFISLKQVKVRVPYGRYPIDKPAAASMIGTVNEDGTGFLNDPSGNRRFGVVQLVDIDWSYEEIDTNQLWAQMYQAYKDGEQFELTHHEKEIQNELNLSYTMSTPLEELFLSFFEYDKSQPDKFMSSMEILEALQNVGLEGKQYQNKIELSSVMTKLGIKPARRRVNGRQMRGYEGVWLETKNISAL